jgi:hypothetical protein
MSATKTFEETDKTNPRRCDRGGSISGYLFISVITTLNLVTGET